jgi:TonB family protein
MESRTSFYAACAAVLALACGVPSNPPRKSQDVEPRIRSANVETHTGGGTNEVKSADDSSKASEEIISQRSEVEPPQVLDAGAEAKVETHAKRGTQKKSARGSLSKQAISDVVRAGYRPLLACVNSAVPPGQVMALTTKVKFTIGPKGAVQKYAVVDGGSGNKAIDRCTLDAVRKLKFPPPEGNVPVVVVYPYRFHFAETGEPPKTEPAPPR